MRIVLWDTRKQDAAKDFAGGYGVGQFPGGARWRSRLIRHLFKRDRRPVALNFAYMAAIFRGLGHTVEYSEDVVPRGADLYVFNPALVTLPLERKAIREALEGTPGCKVLVTGLVADKVPEAFDGLDVTLVQGEPEQLWWKLDEVLASPERRVAVGQVADLDALPLPDWSLFEPKRFRISYDFSAFPTGMVQQSRGCTLKCDYCPYIVQQNAVRFRSPESVVAEMREGASRYGFRSFKFRDPLFGLDRRRVSRLAELIGGLPKKIQFSIESRIDLLKPDVLRLLREVGLTSVTFGVETANESLLREHHRAPISDDRQREFIEACRALGIRTVAGFMIGFPEDTADSILGVLDYARKLNPTFANFNIVTPYPGTHFFRQIHDQIATFDYSQFSVYSPVLKYRHLSPGQVSGLLEKCFSSYFFRSRWLAENGPVIWPSLGRLVVGRENAGLAASVHSSSVAAKSAEAISDGLRKAA